MNKRKSFWYSCCRYHIAKYCLTFCNENRAIVAQGQEIVDTVISDHLAELETRIFESVTPYSTQDMLKSCVEDYLNCDFNDSESVINFVLGFICLDWSEILDDILTQIFKG